MRLLLITLTLSFSLLGCTKNSLDYGLDLKETIRVNCQVEPPTMDWTKMVDTSSHMVSENLMEGLTGIDLTNPELPAIPKLATEWTTKDAKTWTFTLRKGVKWSDGVELTAQHVIDGFERLLNAKTVSPSSYLLFPIKNGEAYFKGTIRDFSLVGVKINGQGQIVIELEKPMSYFPYVVGHQATYPVRKDIIAKYGDDKWADAGRMVTLGAYTLKTWDHDKNIVLERYENYYGAKAKTKNILFYMINDYATAVNLFRSGRLDFQETVPGNEVASLTKEQGLYQKTTLGMAYYGFNVKHPPFDNAKVRRAFALAIDRKQITDILNGGQVPLSGLIPNGMFGYEANVGLKFDPLKAAKLLDEAGFKDRTRLPHVTIGFNTDENNQRVAENIQAQIKKNLGIQVELANEEWKFYLSQLMSDAPSIYRLGWIADYPDPDTFFALFITESENNHSKWSNKAYDGLVAQAATELNKDKRRQLYLRAQKILTEEEVPMIPLYIQTYNNLISPRLKDFPKNPLERIDLKGTTIL